MGQLHPSRIIQSRTLEGEVLFDLRANPTLFVGLTLGVVGYSAGHALLALSAGALARGLAASPLASALPASPPSGPWAWSVTAYSYVGLVAAVVKAGSGALVAHAERKTAASVASRLRVALVSDLLRDGSTVPAPRVLATLAVRLREVEIAVASGVVTAARAALSLAPLATCLIWLSPSLSLIGAVAVVPFALLLGRLRKRTRRTAERSQSLVETLECGVDELVRSADLFRVYGAGARAVAAVERAGAEAGAGAARADALRAGLSGANEVLAALSIVAAVSIGSRFGITSGASALLVPFAAVFFMSYRPLRDLGDARSATLRGALALSAVREALGTRLGPRDASPANRVFDGPPVIDARDFGARDRGPATTFRLEPGEIACLIGPTGSGKTTLLRALLGLEASRGALLLDGQDAANAGTGPSERPFAWVPQDAPLVTGSVADNVLLLGGSDATARAALDDVGAGRLGASDHDARDANHRGDERDVIGPGGRPLSGGERRLLSLARALASSLPVLLLDEPTEGLDPDATRSVLAALARLRGRRSIVIATHREEVLPLADRVVRLGQSAPETVAAE
jgi:ABC-type multidrug transport system fused ATPase/permease subunit